MHYLLTISKILVYLLENFWIIIIGDNYELSQLMFFHNWLIIAYFKLQISSYLYIPNSVQWDWSCDTYSLMWFEFNVIWILVFNQLIKSSNETKARKNGRQKTLAKLFRRQQEKRQY